MSVQSEINRIKGNVTAALAKIAEKGVTVPDGANSDNLEALIEAISAGGGAICFVGSVTMAEDSVTITIEHNLGSQNIGYLAFANDVNRPTNNVHAIMKYVDGHRCSVTYFATYVHDTAPKIITQTDNLITFSNSNQAYVFGAGRTYTVAAWLLGG